MVESSIHHKPRMLFLSGPWDHLDTVRKVGLVEPVETLLNTHFELTVLPGDQDYDAAVRAHAPDIVMFDSGCDNYFARTPVYTNTDTHPDIPKVGFVRQDFHSPMRLNSFGRMEAWGVECFFSPSYPYLGAPQAWRDRVIFIPRWVDQTYMRDYGETKSIPVAMLGAGFFESDFYPWRRRVGPLIARHFPYVHAPRPIPEPHMIVGENYGRMINRSFFTLGCGGASRSLVSKLFEIPGARSVLVTEDTAIVRDAGFVDGDNCVLTDETEVVDRIRYLLNHQDELDALTERGHRFVLDTHTHVHRTQINEWLRLRRQLQPGQRIIQEGCLKPLRIIGATEQQAQFVPFEVSDVTQGLIDGYAALQAEDYGTAQLNFEGTLGHYNYMLEGHLGIGVAFLGQGDARNAIARFGRNTNFQTACHAVVRDPVNQAYLALAFLCGGDPPTAIKYAARAPRVLHPALATVRWILGQVRPGIRQLAPFDGPMLDPRINLHSLDPRHMLEPAWWLQHFSRLLSQCGQGAIVTHLHQALKHES